MRDLIFPVSWSFAVELAQKTFISTISEAVLDDIFILCALEVERNGFKIESKELCI